MTCSRPPSIWRDLRSVPNLLSLARVVVVISAVLSLLFGYLVLGCALGLVAGVSDYFDGYIARRTGQVTELGEILDRFGDLVFESTGFLFAVYFHLWSPLFFLVYFLREFAVVSARHYCAARGAQIASSMFGKLKTNFFGWSFLVLYVAFAHIVPFDWAYDALHGLATVGMLLGLLWGYISGYQYLAGFVRVYNRPTDLANQPTSGR